MQTPQTIVIIGGGAIGKAITRGLSHSHDKVILCDANFEEAQSFTRELQTQHPGYDVEALQCSYEAAWEADIIIFALTSCPDRQEVAKKIKAVANQKTVVVLDDNIDALQELLPHTNIIRAFYNLDAEQLSKPGEQWKNKHCFITGKDAEAVQSVVQLVAAVGLKPVIPGARIVQTNQKK